MRILMLLLRNIPFPPLHALALLYEQNRSGQNRRVVFRYCLSGTAFQVLPNAIPGSIAPVVHDTPDSNMECPVILSYEVRQLCAHDITHRSHKKYSLLYKRTGREYSLIHIIQIFFFHASTRLMFSLLYSQYHTTSSRRTFRLVYSLLISGCHTASNKLMFSLLYSHYQRLERGHTTLTAGCLP